MSPREAQNKGPVDRVVTSGTFSLDGGTWEVTNNVWIVGDDTEVLVIDAAHDGRDRGGDWRPAVGRGGVHPRA